MQSFSEDSFHIANKVLKMDLKELEEFLAEDTEEVKTETKEKATKITAKSEIQKSKYEKLRKTLTVYLTVNYTTPTQKFEDLYQELTNGGKPTLHNPFSLPAELLMDLTYLLCLLFTQTESYNRVRTLMAIQESLLSASPPSSYLTYKYYLTYFCCNPLFLSAHTYSLPSDIQYHLCDLSTHRLPPLFHSHLRFCSDLLLTKHLYLANPSKGGRLLVALALTVDPQVPLSVAQVSE